MKKIITLILLLCTANAYSQLYFPPASGTWQTISPTTLGWCTGNLDSVTDYLETHNSKGFIILKDGKIAFEKYFGTFTVDSFWYWASAGKTLTATLVGIAQQEGLLSINQKTSDFLGTGWTSLPTAKENLITIHHQLSMSTGLDDASHNADCTDDTCLTYAADAGNRWAYHNAPYTLLEKVVATAGGVTYNQYTNSRINNKIGTNILWIKSGYNNVALSRTRDMAKFGLLILNKGIWDTDTILKDTAYYQAMVNTSQSINPSYGYLWWLNGKAKHMLPQTQFVFTGNMFPSAPLDMFAALGKNDQKIYVWPSQNIVVIRVGNAAEESKLALSSFDTKLWEKLMEVFCNQTSVQTPVMPTRQIYPNPAEGHINVSAEGLESIAVFDLTGKQIPVLLQQLSANSYRILIETKGLFMVRSQINGMYFYDKVVVAD